MPLNAPWIVERHGPLHVLRDDLLPGGTKRRGLDILLGEMPETDIAYTGTIFGHGALALAHACADHGKRAHLFLACNDDDHPMLKQLRNANAIIHRAVALPIATLSNEAAAWQAKEADAALLPPAFACPGFEHAMSKALQSFDPSPYTEIWCVQVSGTLRRIMRAAIPSIRIRTVSVAAADTGDHTPPEKYHRPAKSPPPYPSCPYTDAKVWQFAREHAAPGALVWNIAG